MHTILRIYPRLSLQQQMFSILAFGFKRRTTYISSFLVAELALWWGNSGLPTELAIAITGPRYVERHVKDSAYERKVDPRVQPLNIISCTNIVFGHPSSCLYLKTVLFTFQNTTFRRLDSVYVFR
jgi:hypothetical protein